MQVYQIGVNVKLGLTLLSAGSLPGTTATQYNMHGFTCSLFEITQTRATL